MTDTDRLAAALHAACEAEVKAEAERDPGRLFTLHGADAHNDIATLILAADPTLICPDPDAHALADAVRRLDLPASSGWTISRFSHSGFYAAEVYDENSVVSGRHGEGHTLEAAITAALEDQS